jgi:hypothetical protein
MIQQVDYGCPQEIAPPCRHHAATGSPNQRHMTAYVGCGNRLAEKQCLVRSIRVTLTARGYDHDVRSAHEVSRGSRETECLSASGERMAEGGDLASGGPDENQSRLTTPRAQVVEGSEQRAEVLARIGAAYHADERRFLWDGQVMPEVRACARHCNTVRRHAV